MEFGAWATSRESGLLPAADEESTTITVGKKRKKKTRAPAIRKGRVVQHEQDEQDEGLDGMQKWSNVEVEESLVWGCTEGGFLELEELDAGTEVVTDALTGGRIFRQGGTKTGDQEIAEQEAERMLADMAEPKQPKKAAAAAEPKQPKKKTKKELGQEQGTKKPKQNKAKKLTKLEQKKANLEAQLQSVAKELEESQEAEDADVAAETEDGAAEAPAGENKKKKKKKRKKKKKNKLGKKERQERRERVAAEAAEAEEALANPTDVSGWTDLRAQGVHLHESIVANLARLGFTTPTPIQAQALPAAIVKRADVIGGAMTGSGKTLAFGIPMVQQILANRELQGLEEDDSDSSLGLSMSALVLTPTRELAIQVCDHIKMITQNTQIRAMPIVGGMSAQKQMRLLRSKPEIVVATPGRFFELLKDGESWLRLHRLQFFVLDEADRMVEAGHFEELNEILEMLPRGDEAGAKQRQVFLFTATLHASGVDGVGRERKTIDILMKRIPFKGEPVVIDLSDSAGVKSTERVGEYDGEGSEDRLVMAGPAGLRECSILCENSKKDEYLYYFLCRYPGRTIVFVNAISSIRRVIALLAVLKLNAVGLHSNMQQRARLKAVDRFMSNDDVILVATDVAARGIDIKGVKYVVHYQIPKSTDTYVHRRGRTARAGADGMSMALVGEAEVQIMRRILREIGYNATRQLPTFPVDHNYMPPLRVRLLLAKKIDDVARKNKKASAEHEWLKNAAKDLDVDLSDDDNADIAVDGKKARKELAQLQASLDRNLNEPLLPRGFSTRHLAMDGQMAGRILASKAASSSGAPVRQGNAMTVEDAGATALRALEMGKKETAGKVVGVASEEIHTDENAKGEAAAAKSKRPNKRKRGVRPAPAGKRPKKGSGKGGKGGKTAAGVKGGGGGGGGKMVGGVYFPG